LLINGLFQAPPMSGSYREAAEDVLADLGARHCAIRPQIMIS